METGQTDYTLGEAMPVVRAVVQDTSAHFTADACVEESLKAMRTSAEAIGQSMEVLSDGPAEMAGQPGRQIVVRQAAKVPASQATQPAEALYVVQRTICATGGNPRKPRGYSLRLYCLATDAERPKAVMDKLAEKFELVSPPAAEPPKTGPPQE